MPDPRQITDLPVATVADDADLLLMRQGLFDKQVEVGLIRDGLLEAANNLSDIASPAIARTNLGVDLSTFLLAANNLSDVDDPATAVANLGIDTADFLASANNLSDLANVVTARTNLGVTADASTAKLDATNDFNFTLMQEMQVQNYSEVTANAGNITGATDFDISVANVHYATLTGAATVTFSNPPAAGQTGSLFIELTNGGSDTITWPASVEWPGGTAPTLTAAGVDALVFVTRDGGTTYRGFVAGLDFS
jgi:hypothetical protein